MNFIKRVVLLLIPFITVSLYAQDVPRVISYQGVLVDANGKPETRKNVSFAFTFYSDKTSGNVVVQKQSKVLDVIGGLFNTMLEIPPTADLNQQLWLEIEVEGKIFPNRIQMATALYALNIPDNVVTSAKIKDGEVKSDDLSDMGANENQVLTRKGNTWRGEDVPKELPTTANEGQVLVFKNGKWLPETQVVPLGVPVGTILAFYGLSNQIDPDWLLCDGKNVSQTQYPKLFDHLIKLYNSTKLPDLRGMFLRGSDLNSGVDPDNAIVEGNRSYPNGVGANIEKIGSVQNDAFQGHKHNITIYDDVEWSMLGINNSQNSNGWYSINPTRNPISGGLSVGNPRSDGINGEPRTSSETRPKNVYVNYIIKAR